MTCSTSLALLTPTGRWRGAQSTERLAQAHWNLFDAKATRREAQMVPADPVAHSGFYQVAARGASGDELAKANGKCAVYGRLFRFLRLSDEGVRALKQAARQEALADAREGES